MNKVNNTEIRSIDDFQRAVAAAKQQAVVAIYLLRREQHLVVGLRLNEE